MYLYVQYILNQTFFPQKFHLRGLLALKVTGSNIKYVALQQETKEKLFALPHSTSHPLNHTSRFSDQHKLPI